MATTTKVYHHKPYNTVSPTNPANKQDGRTVLITGSTSGIGYAIATAFIQASAAHVILTGRGQDHLDEAVAKLKGISTSTVVSGYTQDITKVTDVQKLWDSLEADNVHVDVLVLNAADSSFGTALPIKSLIPQLRSALDTNVFTNIAMVERFLETETSQPKALINISSFMAHANPAPMQIAYSTSKATFAHTLQLVSDEVSPADCRIINVHPGAILTKELPENIKASVVWDDGMSSNSKGIQLLTLTDL